MTCSNVQIKYPGDGTTVDFTVPFLYQEQSEVKVSLWDTTTQDYVNVTEYDGTDTQAAGHYYQWQNATVIRMVNQVGVNDPPPVPTEDTELNTSPPSLLIYRDTDLSSMNAEFYPGSSIKAQDLNSNFEQLQFAIEESKCDVETLKGDVSLNYWNKTTETLYSGDTWQDSDEFIVTAAAGDDRWLNATEDIIGGDSITSIESGGQVTLNIDLDPNGGLESTNPGDPAGQLRVKKGNGIVVGSAGVTVGQGTGINVNTNDVAVNQVTIWGQTHNHSGNVSGDLSFVNNITFNTGSGRTIQTGSSADDLTIAGATTSTSGALIVNRDLELTTNATIGLGGVTYDPPSADGSANQVLTTDGSGSLSWATNAASDTTYDLTATDNGTDANINLVDSDGSTDTVTIAAGTNVTVDHSGSTITISSTDTNTNTTYDLTVPDGTTDIRLADSNGTDDDITITGGTNVTVTRTSATELDIAATDTNTTYTLPVTASSGNAVLTLTGANPASTDPVTIKAGNNVSFSSIGADGFTINSSGGGGGGDGGADVVANCVGLNTAVTAGPPSGGDLYLVIDSSNMTAAAGTAPGNTTAINDLPETEAAGAPVGGYGGQIQVTLEWDNGNTRWQYIRWSVQEPDNRYVLEQGDTMTGNLL
jgi:hypothetical protein